MKQLITLKLWPLEAALPGELKCSHRTEIGLSSGRRVGSITEEEYGEKAQAGQNKVLQGVTAEDKASVPCRHPFPQVCLLQGCFVHGCKMPTFFHSYSL